MLLEMDNSELLLLLESAESLADKVRSKRSVPTSTAAHHAHFVALHENLTAHSCMPTTKRTKLSHFSIIVGFKASIFPGVQTFHPGSLFSSICTIPERISAFGRAMVRLVA